jgi:transposase-like protein
MGQVLHGCAMTTEAVRRAIQHSQKSLRALAKHHGINQKTVAKWKKRSSVADLPTGPKEPKSTVLSTEDEAIIVAFRRHTLLPLDDCLYALQATLPHLTRSSLHRCLQRHGISRLPEVEGDSPNKRKFKTYPIGYFHIDIAEVRTAQGRLYLFVASIGPRSSPSPSCTRRLHAGSRPTSCCTSSKRSPTRSIPC